MAVDVCTEISSPRISFSYDLKDIVPSSEVVVDHCRRSDPNPTVDFDFCIGGQYGFPHHQISSADELFADGKILPVQIKQFVNPQKSDPIRQSDVVTSANTTTKTTKKKMKKRLVEFLSSSNDEDDDEDEIEKPSSNSKPFWQFRSSENGRGNGLLRLRSLHFLTRSKSTGSVPNPNPPGFSKPIRKQHSLREGSSINNNYRSNSSALNHYYYPYYNNNKNNNSSNTTSYKPPLRPSTSRSYGGGGGNGVRINPVLNIPPAYIAKGTVSLFGSFFGSKKSKKKR